MLEELALHVPAPQPPPKTAPQSISLGELNLDQELHDNYIEVKDFLARVMLDVQTPPNQVAQVFNTLTAVLKEITKTQTDVYNAERVKKLELAMIHALKLAPSDVQDAFFAEFERLCG